MTYGPTVVRFSVFLTLTLDEKSSQLHAAAALPPEKEFPILIK